MIVGQCMPPRALPTLLGSLWHGQGTIGCTRKSAELVGSRWRHGAQNSEWRGNSSTPTPASCSRSLAESQAVLRCVLWRLAPRPCHAFCLPSPSKPSWAVGPAACLRLSCQRQGRCVAWHSGHQRPALRRPAALLSTSPHPGFRSLTLTCPFRALPARFGGQLRSRGPLRPRPSA